MLFECILAGSLPHHPNKEYKTFAERGRQHVVQLCFFFTGRSFSENWCHEAGSCQNRLGRLSMVIRFKRLLFNLGNVARLSICILPLQIWQSADFQFRGWNLSTSSNSLQIHMYYRHFCIYIYISYSCVYYYNIYTNIVLPGLYCGRFDWRMVCIER